MTNPIVTGQQIGLLGGPLYTTYKVLGAIHYSRILGTTPIYWLETNDADFNEICSINFLDKDNMLRTLVWDIDSQGFSCGFVEVDGKLLALLDAFFTHVKQTAHTDSLRTIVLDCYKKGVPLGIATREFARKLFHWPELTIFDPSEDSFLAAIRPILEAEAAVTREGDQCNFFCIDEKKRMAVFKEKDGFTFRDGRKIDLDNYKLTPNVKTRNVCQDAFFRTHTYIAGPGEIKYIAELDPVYERHHINKTAVKKRMSIELIEPKTKRLLKQCALSIHDVISMNKDMLVKHVLERETGSDFNEIKNSATEATKKYINQLDLLGLDTAELNKFLPNEIKTLTGKKRAREKESVQILLQKTRELSDRLLPFGQKQERVFTILYYMNLYGGLDFITWLFDHYNFDLQTMEIEYG
ncbi:MAG: bacillithiol biosynthesis BshC [Spirochaetales bacterium]|nr:bacillithiol biosynthesis BshC [Spirochaetales bacterium]